jgi:hypothetical protein
MLELAEELERGAVSPTIDLRAEFSVAGIGEVRGNREWELVGLKLVKARIRQIASLSPTDRVPRKLGFATESPTLCMSSLTASDGPVSRDMLMLIKPANLLGSQVISAGREAP